MILDVATRCIFCYSEWRAAIQEGGLTPIIVADRSKTWIVFVCWSTGTSGSNSARGMDVCAYSVCIDRLYGVVIRVPAYRSRGPGFDSRRYQIFWEVLGLERGALSLLSIIEELLGRHSRGFSLESRGYGRGNPFRWPRYTFYPWKLALISPTNCGRSVGRVCSRTKATEFAFWFIVLCSSGLVTGRSAQEGVPSNFY
jgi:hypothetical protein